MAPKNSLLIYFQVEGVRKDAEVQRNKDEDHTALQWCESEGRVNIFYRRHDFSSMYHP